jgi:hypothetical protein
MMISCEKERLVLVVERSGQENGVYVYVCMHVSMGVCV